MSTLATPQTATTTWNIDPAHSVAEFKVKHMMISNVKGQFAKVSGVLTLNESELTNSSVEALIEAASIETRDAQRDTHLKSEDFLHVEKFPTLTFKSTSISLVRDGHEARPGPGAAAAVARGRAGPAPRRRQPQPWQRGPLAGQPGRQRRPVVLHPRLGQAGLQEDLAGRRRRHRRPRPRSQGDRDAI